MEKVVDIKDRYSTEIEEIAYILRNLENGRVYGYNGNASKMDGSLAQNAQKLRKEIGSLLSKVEYGKDSISEEIGEAFFGTDK